MDEMESIQIPTSASVSKKKLVREPPSVPFLWEVRPGIPKKDWKPEARSVPVISSIPTVPPVKLVASVPFKWEEKPGTPLPSFSQPSQALVLYGHYMPSSSSANVFIDESLDHLWTDTEAYGDDDENTSVWSETSYSYSSVAPSLMSNCLVSSLAISTAVPAPAPPTEVNGFLPEPGYLSSPESESGSSTSSYATGSSSLVGSSFLECLFPLFPPNSGFLGKVSAYSGGENGHKVPDVTLSQKLDVESRASDAVRKPPTLGELIMMSRRRSCQRKAAQMRKYDFSMEFMKGKAFGCCGFGKGTTMIKTLQSKTKQLPRLKLVW